MATITRRTSPAVDYDGSTMAVAATLPPDLVAGEAIPGKGYPCYIAANGKVMLSNGATSAVTAKVRGWSIAAAAIGRPIELSGGGVQFGYAAPGTFTPGTDLYVGGAGGALDATASTYGTTAVAFAVTDTDIMTRTN